MPHPRRFDMVPGGRGRAEGAGLAVTIRVEGQASKRGLIPRLPTADRLVADARDWITAEYGQVVRAAGIVAQGSCPELRLDLHPAAEPVTLGADDEGRVVVTAETAGAGPGYHTFVCRALDRLGEELEITWSRDHDPRQVGTPAPWVGSRQPLADRGVVEKEHLALLGRAVERAADQRRQGQEAIHVGLRPDIRFQFDGAIGTPLGPRDDAWLSRASKDPWGGADIRPWWFDVMDARYLLARALVILWTETRWRAPADDAERAALDEVLALLRKALPSDASLAYPWREWAELITLRAAPDPIADRVFRQAQRVDPALPLVGYRRRPVTIVHEGWQLTVPGTFSERRSNGEWQGGERGRQVTIAATVTQTSNGIPMSADRFLTTVAGDLGEGVLHHEDGELRGRARVTSDASSGVEVAVLEGFSAVTGSGAAIRVAFDSSEDWKWAIDLWRSLRPA
jgi:hypothetical protein